MPRTNLVNAVDVELAAAVATPDGTITVDTSVPLPPVPFYLVIDPFSDTQGREYQLCTNVAVNVLTVTRNLAGSESTVHDVEDIVRITIAAQHISDLWTDIEAIPPQTFLHADLTDAAALPSAHHPRYIDTEAVGAMGVEGDGNPLNHLKYTDAQALAQANTLDHDHATPIEAHRANVGAHHTRYLDSEAIAAVGPHTDPQTFLHANLTDVGSLPSAHHAKYLDSEAVNAMGGIADGNPLNHTKFVDPGGIYLPLTGGTLTGDLLFQNNNAIVSGYIEAFPGARELLRIGAGANSGLADAPFIQIIGLGDVSPTEINMRFGAVSGLQVKVNQTAIAAGSLSLPALKVGSSEKGLFQVSNTELGVGVQNFQAMRIQGVGGLFGAQNVYDATDGAVADVNVNSNGFIRRSTSALKYKENVRDATGLEDLVLRPVRFTHIESQEDYIGFIADEIAEQDERAGVFRNDEIENYDLRAVVAILAAKVNRLESV